MLLLWLPACIEYGQIHSGMYMDTVDGYPALFQMGICESPLGLVLLPTAKPVMVFRDLIQRMSFPIICISTKIAGWIV